MAKKFTPISISVQKAHKEWCRQRRLRIWAKIKESWTYLWIAVVFLVIMGRLS